VREVIMKIRSIASVLLVLLLALTVSACSLAAGIFKAGFWSGILIVAVIVIGLVFLATRARG
jgi:hypothetical protein